MEKARLPYGARNWKPPYPSFGEVPCPMYSYRKPQVAAVCIRCPEQYARLDGYQGDYIDQIVSGTDGFCMTNDQIAKQTVLDYLDATDDGALVEHIKQAAKDYYYMLSRSNGINGFSSNTEIVTLTPWWQTALNSCIAVFSVLTAAGLALLTVTLIRNKKKEGK